MIVPMLLWLVSVSRISRVTPPWSKAFTFDRGMWTTVVQYPTRFRIHLWHVMPCNKETWNSTANSTSCELNKAHHIICFTSIFTAGEGYPYSISGGYAWCPPTPASHDPIETVTASLSQDHCRNLWCLEPSQGQKYKYQSWFIDSNDINICHMWRQQR